MDDKSKPPMRFWKDQEKSGGGPPVPPTTTTTRKQSLGPTPSSAQNSPSLNHTPKSPSMNPSVPSPKMSHKGESSNHTTPRNSSRDTIRKSITEQRLPSDMNPGKSTKETPHTVHSTNSSIRQHTSSENGNIKRSSLSGSQNTPEEVVRNVKPWEEKLLVVEKEKEILKEKLEAVEKERDLLKNRIQSGEKDRRLSVDKDRPPPKDKLEKEKETLEKEKNSLEKEKSSLEKEKNALEKEKNAVEKERDNLKQQNVSLEKEKGSLEKEKNALEKEKNSLEKENHSNEKERKSMKEKLEALEKERDLLKQQNQALEKEKDGKQSTVDKEKTALEKEKHLHEKEKKSLKEKLEALEKERDLLKQQNQTLEKEKSLLEKEKNSLEKKEGGEKDKEKDALKQQNQALEKEKNSLKERVETLEREKETLRQINQSLEKEKMKATEKYELVVKEKKTLESLLDVEAKLGKTTENQLNSTHEEIEKLKQDYEIQIAELQEQIGALLLEKSTILKKTQKKETVAPPKQITFSVETLAKAEMVKDSWNKKYGNVHASLGRRSGRSRAISDPLQGKTQDKFLFPLSGTPLVALQLDDHVPTFLRKGLTYLENPVFQVEGPLADPFRYPLDVEKEKGALQAGNWQISDQRCMGPLIVQFFMNLLEPLFPPFMLPYLVSWKADVDIPKHRQTVLFELIHYMLPETNRHVLHFMISYFVRVCSRTSLAKSHFIHTFGSLFLTGTFHASEHSEVGEAIVDFVITHYEPIFCTLDKDVSIQLKNETPCIMSVSVNKLLEKLKNPIFVAITETDFENIVLMTHQYFIPANSLLQNLIFSYKNEKSVSWGEKMKQQILRVMRVWIGQYGYQLRPQQDFCQKLSTFIQEHDPQNEDVSFYIFKSFLDTKPIHKSRGSSFELKPSSEMDILEEDPLDVAAQFCHLDYESFKMIQPHEFLCKNFTEEKQSPNFFRMADIWNNRWLWVLTQIFQKDKTSKRVNVVIHFIKIAEALRNYNNFFSASAIMAGLSHRLLDRQVKLWDKVPKKLKEIVKDLQNLFTPLNNYKLYRDALVSAGLPCVPYIPILSKDMTAIEEKATFLSEDLINFTKMRDIWKTLKQISHFQSTRFKKLSVNTDLCFVLKNPKTLSEAEINQIADNRIKLDESFGISEDKVEDEPLEDPQPKPEKPQKSPELLSISSYPQSKPEKPQKSPELPSFSSYPPPLPPEVETEPQNKFLSLKKKKKEKPKAATTIFGGEKGNEIPHSTTPVPPQGGRRESIFDKLKTF